LIALLSGASRREIEQVVRSVEKIETPSAAVPGPLRRSDGDSASRALFPSLAREVALPASARQARGARGALRRRRTG